MTPTRYELRIRGRLSEDLRQDLREDFGALDVSDAPPETVLLGEVLDDAELHGVLARLHSLGLQLLSLRAVPK